MMQDLSKIDFSKCKLPEWSGESVGCVHCGSGFSVILIRDGLEFATLATRDMIWRYARSDWADLEVAKTYTDRVDAFIASELAKSNEPEWRPCSKEFALANPDVSQAAHFHPQHGGWSDWECVNYWAYDQPDDRYRFRTQVSSPQQPDTLDTRNPGRTYSARGERKVTSKFGTSLGFAGGRENTPRAEIVRSNYYGANHNEANIQITGQCSVETLRAILGWAESQLELVPDEDRCYPAAGWWRVK